MEGISTNVYKGIRSYWKRKGYKRLNDDHVTDQVGPDTNQGPGRRRRFWRVKMGRRVRLWRRVRVGSLKKWLKKLRDSYVNMMLNWANSGLVGGGFGGGSVGYGSGFAKDPVKEYDEKVIVEIYKSILMRQGHHQLVVPRHQVGAKISLQSLSVVSTR